MNKVNDSLIEKQRKSSRSDIIFYGILAAIIALFIFLLATNTGVRVEGRSMVPTLNDGEVLIVSTITPAKKGKIVVIKGEQTNWIIKRVIATEGDKVEFRDDGFVYINGTLYQDEFGLVDHSNRVDAPFTEKVLEKGEYFYLGDNRDNSSDSRDYGTCKIEQIVGVVYDWAIGNKFISTVFFWI